MDEFNSSKPIYLQLADRINRLIVSKELKAGQKLQSVREMALSYNVNPNTIQRTYSELEREGVLETRRGQGSFVTEQEERLIQLRGKMKEEQIETFVQVMREMGFSSDEIVSGLRDHLLKMNKGDESVDRID
ncbi:GntR family transcriptional regulator [Paenibacillus sacheonensis]|uniref:GntR family transcriptional regulator n=1 Tax=Paenibacillus sacheonensis TaxID=742054 RepID=A0A7X4YVN1_9BACL|nr:GntR family transcriptional regulator [Paenibacillus sacheonensis]MBM7568487.1 DNA-binding transcriptional regulator YhcF (GntR family) [Paenibacillus sacheonensis]NBC72314.1 GntR family transcriptional regulator [Paenibacillus sacheonensis]